MAEKTCIALCLEYPLALRGGVSVLVETLIQGLYEKYDIVLVSPDDPKDIQDRSGIFRHIHWSSGNASFSSARKLARLIAEQKVQLAHFHMGGNYGWGNRFPGYSPIEHLGRLGVKTVSSVHLVVNPLDGYCGPQKPLWFKLAMFPLAWLGKMHQLWHVQREIAVSKHDASKLRKWYRPFAFKIVQLYHSRLELKSRKAEILKREPLILNVGHIAWRKGQIVLAEAFVKVASKYPEWKLSMPGGFLEKETVEKIRKIASDGGLTDRILLPGERNDALQMMQTAGVYVQPSYYEALGLALQEALFQGCPGIGTRAGGIPELIDEGSNGFLVDPGSVEQLAAALEKLMSNPKLREEFGRNGAASIVNKGMTREQMIRNHIELYESTLQGR
jgi:glycosyltransferase involved in cell wall biosynthesis